MANTKKAKTERRQKEIIRAQLKSVTVRRNSESVSTLVEEKFPRRESFRLDLRSIKTDLIKTTLFVFFAVALLFFLRARYS